MHMSIAFYRSNFCQYFTAAQKPLALQRWVLRHGCEIQMVDNFELPERKRNKVWRNEAGSSFVRVPATKDEDDLFTTFI